LNFIQLQLSLKTKNNSDVHTVLLQHTQNNNYIIFKNYYGCRRVTVRIMCLYPCFICYNSGM
jgi:hypothetical protein